LLVALEHLPSLEFVSAQDGNASSRIGTGKAAGLKKRACFLYGRKTCGRG
jgi:hypothetical protein